MKQVQDMIAEAIASIVGWLFCLGVLVGAYVFGRMFAVWTGAVDEATAYGLLSALAVVWLYEHRVAYDRWERLKERLDGLWAKMTDLD